MLNQATKLLFVSILIASFLSGCSTFPTQNPQSVSPIQVAQPTDLKPNLTTPSIVGSEPQTTYPGFETSPQDTYPLEGIPTIKSIGQLQPPNSAPIPDTDHAAVSGLLFVFDLSVVLANKIIYLSPAVMIDGKPSVSPIITSPSIENGDYIAMTDESGNFEINNIDPGDYYLMVNYPDHTVIGLSSPNTSQVLLISLEAGSSVPLGIVYVVR
jgi:hypothetical protein